MHGMQTFDFIKDVSHSLDLFSQKEKAFLDFLLKNPRGRRKLFFYQFPTLFPFSLCETELKSAGKTP